MKCLCNRTELPRHPAGLPTASACRPGGDPPVPLLILQAEKLGLNTEPVEDKQLV